MTIPRMIGLLVGLTVIGIAVVTARVEQAKHDRRIQELRFEQTQISQRIWQQEIELARLRSPEMIRERAGRFGLLEDVGKKSGTAAATAPRRR
jgi:hypothetical protein